MNNRILIPVLIFPLVVALIVGLFFVFRADDNVEPKDPDATDNGTIVDPEDIQHTTGNGHTNISDDKFICFGVKGLMEANKKFKDAMSI